MKDIIVERGLARGGLQIVSASVFFFIFFFLHYASAVVRAISVWPHLCLWSYKLHS